MTITTLSFNCYTITDSNIYTFALVKEPFSYNTYCKLFHIFIEVFFNPEYPSILIGLKLSRASIIYQKRCQNCPCSSQELGNPWFNYFCFMLMITRFVTFNIYWIIAGLRSNLSSYNKITSFYLNKIYKTISNLSSYNKITSFYLNKLYKTISLLNYSILFRSS